MIAVDIPPFIRADAQGRLHGLDAWLAQDIAKELGVSLEIVRAAPTFDKVVASVARGDADLGISFLSITLARAKMVYFSHPYLTLRHALLVNRLAWLAESKKLPARDIRQTTAAIGAQRESTHAPAARSAFVRAPLREFGSFEELVAAVERGEILAALDNDFRLRRYFKLHPEASLRMEIQVQDDLRDLIAIAVRPDSPQLLAWVNTYLAVKALDLKRDDLLEQFDR
jgi:ABC-type amino acid transport substrate-binding protein